MPEVVENTLKSKVTVGDFYRKLLEVCTSKGFDFELFSKLMKIRKWRIEMIAIFLIKDKLTN